jgi:hypothetical protein
MLFPHQWLKTDTYESGMGPAGTGADVNPDVPATPSQTTTEVVTTGAAEGTAATATGAVDIVPPAVTIGGALPPVQGLPFYNNPSGVQ